MYSLKLNNHVAWTIEEECILSKAPLHMSSEMSRSSSHWELTVVKGSKSSVFSKELTFPVAPLVQALVFKMDSKRESGNE